MTETAHPQGRSRSDSLQRMLELEKKMVLHRTQSSAQNSHQSTPAGSVPPSPLPQPRRFELIPKDGKRAPPPVRNYGSNPPPLSYSGTAPVVTGEELSALLQRKPVPRGHSRHASEPPAMQDKPAHKTVAFAFPPEIEDPKPVCQSPTWEAYNRQKQERKERKQEREQERQREREEERRGREQTVNKEAKPRGRRLSKAPPTSRGLASQGRSQTESTDRSSRSSSVLGMAISRRDTRERETREEPAERSRRGRSGSLTSAFRGSFEIRRGSYDQTTPSGFLGGVKLEKKKQDFTQQVIEDQAKGSTVHPALRKSFLGHGSFTPLKTAPGQSPDPENEQQQDEDESRRAYPPISGIQNKPLMAPQQLSVRRDSTGSANIYLWSARAKKKVLAPENECAVTDDDVNKEENSKPVAKPAPIHAPVPIPVTAPSALLAPAPPFATVPSAAPVSAPPPPPAPVAAPISAPPPPPVSVSAPVPRSAPAPAPAAVPAPALTPATVASTTASAAPVDSSFYIKESGLTRRGGVHSKTSPRASLISKFSIEDHGDDAESETAKIKPLNIHKRDLTPTGTEPPAYEPPAYEPMAYEPKAYEREAPEPKAPEIKAPEPKAPEPKAPEAISLDTTKAVASEQKDKSSYPPATARTRTRRESISSAVSSPPAPPRKSSKRSSLVFLSRSHTAPVETGKQESPRNSKETQRVDKKILTIAKSSSGKRNATPPSIRYESTLAGVRPTHYPAESPTSTTAKWNFKDTAKSAFGRGNSSQSSISPPSTANSSAKPGNSPVIPPSPLKNETVVPSHLDAQPSTKPTVPKSVSPNPRATRPSPEHLAAMTKQKSASWRPTTSSSDDSLYSDALQTTSGPGTPDTSPPQSDSGYTPKGKQGIQYSPYWSPAASPDMSACDRFQLSDSQHSEEDLDPIEAAAKRVLEAFSNANLRSPPDSRQDMYSSTESSQPPTPTIESQPPRLRHKEKSKGRLRPAHIQTTKLSQSSGPKATRSTPNLDGRTHKSGQSTAENSKSSQGKPNPQRGDRVGKMFVICCECKRYHDIPVKLYKTMLNPGGVFSQADSMGFEDRVTMTVKCSWCYHEMSTKCCPGVSGILDIQERMH